MSHVEVSHFALAAKDDVAAEVAVYDAVKFAAAKGKAVELTHKGKKYVIDLEKYALSLLGK